MEQKIPFSIIFNTASGHKVEVTKAQMEKVRNKLWVNDNDKSDGHIHCIKQNVENKENDGDYFNDSFDDFYNELVIDHLTIQVFSVYSITIFILTLLFLIFFK